MSEKTLWAGLKKRGVRGIRLEGCNTKGVPDLYILNPFGGRGCFVELKDWTAPAKHPLSVEQMNFLSSAHGKVIIKIDKKHIAICDPAEPLCSCDVTWARSSGQVMQINEITADELWVAICV